MDYLAFTNVCKQYDAGHKAIDNVSLRINQGEFVTILGPSGCGKTTLLKLINKLIPFDSGSITIDGVCISTMDTVMMRRNIGYVIQRVGLLPHYTIEQNITYVLTLNKVPAAKKHERAVELIELIGLDPSYLGKYPIELSGGQQQRVGVARAIACRPNFILMDEPFSAIDEIARTTLQDELLNIHHKVGSTIVFVTHDIAEALKLGTKVVLMKDGHIEQMGTPHELVFEPQTDFVKEFIGMKGFQASLDERILRDLYEKQLAGGASLQELHQGMRELS